MAARIERLVTSGQFSLDGGTWDVDNNVWIVGDDHEAIVIDAAHDANAIAEAVGDRRLTAIVEPQPLFAPVCRDPDDDHVLACALAAQADLIVTRDLDLLDLKTFQNIHILAAADALRRVEAQR